jgi:hypothetical protein
MLAIAVVTPLSAFAQTPPPPAPAVEAAPPAPPPPDPTPPPAPPMPPVAAVPEASIAAPMAPPAAEKAPAVEDKPWYQLLTLEGLVDTYYMLNLGHLDNAADSLTSPALRNFDVASNSFTLNYAKVGLGFSLNPVSFRLDLGYGHTGALINGASGLESAMGAAAALYGNAFFVQQAFASLALGQLTIDMGKFVTTAGAEVIEANKNWLYSRSLLFFAIPLVHTGLRLNFKVNDMLTLQASAVNGVNNDPDNNANKTFGFSASLAPLPTTSVVATAYFGKRGVIAMEGPTAVFLDLVASHNVSDKLGVNFNFDYVRVGSASWMAGGSLMGRLVLNENLVLAGRGELLKDNAYMVAALPDTMIYEGTLMLGFPFAKRFEARVEGRGDFSADPIFNGEDNQFTGTLAFLGYM